jgi:hypothetical protein
MSGQTNAPKRRRALFEKALEQPADLRTEFVNEQSDGDAGLAEEVLELLQAHDAAPERFLADPAWKRRTEPALSPGMSLDAYRIVRELGSGGMGTVYEVERSDGVFERRSALKVLRPDKSGPQFARRFQEERAILARLNHPNIARIVDGGSIGDLPFFVMDYVEGAPIDTYCASTNLSLLQRLLLFIKVCRAVEYLHGELVIHSDLKPSNILVDRNGEPKLVDFGIAKLVQDAATAPGETSGIQMLTPGYASPEQIRGEPATRRSDIYALGAVLHELLTGSRPHEHQAHGSMHGYLQSATHNDLPLPSGVDGGEALKGDIDAILMHALKRDAAERYSSAEALAADIENYLATRPVMARRGGLLYRLGKLLRRNRPTAAALVLLLLLLAYGVHLTLENQRLRQIENGLRYAAESRLLNLVGAKPNPNGSSTLTAAQVDDIRTFLLQYQGQLAEAIRIRPGLTPERREMLTLANQYLERVEPLAGSDPDQLYLLASAHYAIGTILGYPNETNLGYTKGASDSYRKALRLANRVLELRPDHRRARELIVLTEGRMQLAEQSAR